MLFTRLAGSAATERAMRRENEEGHLHRLRRGVYLEGDDWESSDARLRHVATVVAQLQRLRSPVVVSHASAGALWDLPVKDAWPERVHVYDLGRNRAQTTSTLVRHVSAEPPASVSAGGLLCTSAARTAVDMGLDSFVQALMVFDDGLRRGLFGLDDLEEELARRGRAPGLGDARRALPLADACAGSPAESMSRGVILELGFPRPVLQKRFPQPRGGEYLVDFWWEEFGIVGEFDGREKYRSEAMRRGLTLEEVILREKERSDDLRARPEVQNIVRWKYADARDPKVLRRILLTAGLPATS